MRGFIDLSGAIDQEGNPAGNIVIAPDVNVKIASKSITTTDATGGWQLLNPTGTGKILTIKSCFIQATANSDIYLVDEADALADDRSADLANLDPDDPSSSVAEFYTQAAAGTTIGTRLTTVYAVANMQQVLWGLIGAPIRAGHSITFQPSTARSIRVTMTFTEADE